jgi:SAM-dependent methyltransferase
MKDVLGEAISDYYHHTSPGRLWVHSKHGPKEQMPVDVYFRSLDDMPDMEWTALQQCRGRILDIGAGAGSHALALQRMGHDVTALEISPRSAAVMKERTIEKIICANFFGMDASSGTYDTLLLMMNGIGLSGTLNGLREFLTRARQLLNPGGQLIFDSSNVAYLYDGKPPVSSDYYGEVLFQYEYKRQHSDWFKWLFIDRKTLKDIMTEEGWQMEVIAEDPWDQFLVRAKLG